MFHLVNEFGNVHRNVASEKKRDELIALGYRVVEDKPEKPKQTRKKTEKQEGDAE